MATNEECEVAAEFGDEWAAYAARAPAFVPRLSRPGTSGRGAMTHRRYDERSAGYTGVAHVTNRSGSGLDYRT
ncbi:hypothetical protein [Nocardia abscessus]|uniref:hypothetical protein n=1 Tax=Nocardia abscessus TaxID=120957 RepID=UPI00245584E4|nr:hypothetical protein [Nocardia abscessus]